MEYQVDNIPIRGRKSYSASRKPSRIRTSSMRLFSTDIIVHRLREADALQASICTVRSVSPVPQPRKRAKKIESKPGGGSITCKRVQRYCMQSSHLQVSIPWMYLCVIYLSLRLQSAAPTLKGERWRDARKEGLVLSAAMPRDLLRGDRSSRGARPRG